MGCISLVTILGEVAVGVFSHSLALLANAGHDFSDSLAVGVSIIAAYLITKAPTNKKTFGYLRTSILAAVFNAGVIGITAVLLIVFSTIRFGHPIRVISLNLIVMGSISVLSNLAVAIISSSNSKTGFGLSHKGNLMTTSTAVHFLIDAIGSVMIVAVGLATMADRQLKMLDPIAAILISAFALYTTYKLIVRSWNILMEATPIDINIEDVIKSVESMENIANMHDVHIWSISSDYYAMSAHIMIENNCSLDAVQDIINSVKSSLAKTYHIDHLTIEPETIRCDISENNCL